MSLPETLRQIDRNYVLWRGRRLCYFAGCDYFRLASHPDVIEAAREGLGKFGLNVAASRMTTGNHPLYGKLESRLANFFGVETATLASNGYSPNLMVAQALAGQVSHALLDARAHVSLVDAAHMLDCPVIRFQHRDPEDLGRVLRRLAGSTPLVMTDGLFSHDGSVAPLQEYLRLLPRHGQVLVDDAHAAGVLGQDGRGTPEHAKITSGRIIQTITLSKAFGVYGGAVLGSRKLRASIIARSRIFVGNTPLPLPLANAAFKAVALLRQNPGLRSRLYRNAAVLKQRLRAGGLILPDMPGSIIPVIPRSPGQITRLRKALPSAGIYPSFLRYPGGPPGGYFRFVVSSEHTLEQIKALARVLIQVLSPG